jgi:uncharacterized membrane protein
MLELALPAAFLPLSHFGISSTPLRAALIGKIGEQAYRGLYSLITVGAFFWLVRAYRAAPMETLWVAPDVVRLAALPIVFVAFLLVVAGGATPNPSVVGADALLDRPDIVRGMVRITRNPFLWGVGLWSLAHIAALGDLASLLFFGSIGLLGLLGAFLLDAKKARQHGPRWEAFASQTSSVPFLAIAEGRQRLALGEIGLWRIALASAVFAGALLAHRWAFGVSPLAFL